MKTKLLALCLAAALVAGLSGCGRKSAQETPGVQPTLSPEEIRQQQAVFNPSGTVLAENGGFKITVDDLRWAQSGGTELDLILENTNAQDLTVSYASCSINGYMVQATFSRVVPAQSTVEETLVIFTDELTDLGMTDLADLTVSFSLSDEVGGYRILGPNSLVLPIAALYDYAASPLQQAMSDPVWVQDSVYELLHSATDLCNQDGVVLRSAYLLADPFGYRYLYLELENGTQASTAVELGDIRLNGVTLSDSGYAHCAIDSGKRYLALLALDPLIPAGEEANYATLTEVGLSVNGAPASISIPQ